MLAPNASLLEHCTQISQIHTLEQRLQAFRDLILWTQKQIHPTQSLGYRPWNNYENSHPEHKSPYTTHSNLGTQTLKVLRDLTPLAQTNKYLMLQLWNTGWQGVQRPYTLNTECQTPRNRSLKKRSSMTSETICTELRFPPLRQRQTLVKDHQSVEKLLLILNAYTNTSE